MKIITITMLSFFAASAFCADVRSTVSDIEFTRNAKCTKSAPSFKFCTGLSINIPTGPEYARERREAEARRVCTYNVRLSCTSNSGDFSHTLRVRETYKGETVTEIQ